jgi:hypothetical protein
MTIAPNEALSAAPTSARVTGLEPLHVRAANEYTSAPLAKAPKVQNQTYPRAVSQGRTA